MYNLRLASRLDYASDPKKKRKYLCNDGYWMILMQFNKVQEFETRLAVEPEQALRWPEED